MLRRLVVVCLLLGCLTACEAGPSLITGQNSPVGDYWLTEPATDADRLELLRRARNIDPCAVLQHEVLAELGTVLSIHNSGATGCNATVGTAGSSAQGTYQITALVNGDSDPVYGPNATVAEVDGITLMTQRDVDITGGQEDDFTVRSCWMHAVLPSKLTFILHTTTPAGTDPCAHGKDLLWATMSEWNREPPQGSSPDTELTVVTGADPCAVLPLLGVTTPADEQYLWACEFVYRDITINLSYRHQAKGARPEQQIDRVGTHPIYHDRVGDEVVYYAELGPPMANSDPSSVLGPVSPTLAVSGTDPAVVDEVLRRTLSLFPEQ
ncbi:hypothetical protein [Nocardia testacea]|uniref:hypothetical protein n=1 Tax=Nocardia testacea TaxID=248551 RepID=UPI003A89294A